MHETLSFTKEIVSSLIIISLITCPITNAYGMKREKAKIDEENTSYFSPSAPFNPSFMHASEPSSSSSHKPRDLNKELKTQELLDLQHRADRKDPEACYDLGRYIYKEEYNKGGGNLERYNQAVSYLNTAVSKGHSKAASYLQKIGVIQAQKGENTPSLLNSSEASSFSSQKTQGHSQEPKASKKKSKKKKTTIARKESVSPSFTTASLSLRPEEKEPETIMILSLDGGGIRGIIPARILYDLEEKLAQEYGRDIHIALCFDIIAGTSTGAILGLGLTTPTESHPQGHFAKELLALYEDHGEEIFHLGFIGRKIKTVKNLASPRYKPENFEKVAHQYFGDTKLSELKKRVLIPAYDMDARSIHIFDSDKATQLKSHDCKVEGIARATSAAPTYFPAAVVQSEDKQKRSFVDGGITRNNPTEEAYLIARDKYPHAKRFFILSLGTGEAPKTRLPTKLKKGGLLGWASHAPEVMMEDNTQGVDSRMAAEQTRSNGQVKYVRIQPTLDPQDAQMDDAKKAHIAGLKALANNIIEGRDRPNAEQLRLALPELRSRLSRLGIFPSKYNSDPALNNAYTQIMLATSQGMKELSFTGREIDNKKLIAIQGILNEQQPNISILRLTRTHIDKESIPVLIETLSSHPSITGLILDHNGQLGDEGIESLEGIVSRNEGRIKLNVLSLRRIGIGERGVNALLRLSCSKDIGSIIISNRDVPQNLKESVRKIQKIKFKTPTPPSSHREVNTPPHTTTSTHPFASVREEPITPEAPSLSFQQLGKEAKIETDSSEAHKAIFKGFLKKVGDGLSPNSLQPPSIYICYNNDDENLSRAENLATNFLDSGVPYEKIYFAPWACRAGGGIDRFNHVDRILDADKVILLGSPKLKSNYGERRETISQELNNLRIRILGPKKTDGIIPVWFGGEIDDNFPSIFRGLSHYSLDKNYMASFFDLLIDIYQLNPTTNYILDIKKSFERGRKILPKYASSYEQKVKEQERKKDAEDEEELSKMLEDSLAASEKKT